MEVYTDNWINVKIINNYHSNTFEIPTEIELNDIKNGYSVKISNGLERFWVSVIDIKEYYIIGKVDNKLVHNNNYDYGSFVMFEKDNIYDIHDLEFKKMMLRYASNKRKVTNNKKSKKNKIKNN
tara:strand:+ start:4923 stop:5294 length:372 start_codon:yes stop_codon:yes gene_type:complete